MFTLDVYQHMFELGMYRAILEEHCHRGFKIKQTSDGRIRLGVCSDMVTVPEDWVEGAIVFLAEGVLVRCKRGDFNC